MQKKHLAILLGATVLIGGGVAAGLLVKRAKSKKKVALAVPVTSATPASSKSPVTTTGTSSTAVTATPVLPLMTDDQAATWATNIIVLWKSTDVNAAIAAAAALYPLMNLGMSADQMKKLSTAAPSDADRRVIKARYALAPQT